MTGLRSMLCFIMLLTLISALLVGLMMGCDENKIASPLTGPAAGSGPVGGGDTQSMKLTASPSGTIAVVGVAEASAKVTALVNNSIGQPMPDGTAVHWSATAGTLDAATQTTSNGAATVTVTFSTTFSGCSTVSAESGDASGSIVVCVSRTEPTPTPTATSTPSKSFVVSTANTNIPHKGSTTISAYVTTNAKPEAGVQVKFSVSGGGVLSESAALTDENGYARVTFTGNNTSASDVTATISASTDDGRTGSVNVIVGTGATPTPTPLNTQVTLTSSSYIGTCSSFTTPATLTATVLQNGIPVTNVPVVFSVTFNPTTATECTLNPLNPLPPTQSSSFLCASCSPTFVARTAKIRATAAGSSAEVTITVTGP